MDPYTYHEAFVSWLTWRSSIINYCVLVKNKLFKSRCPSHLRLTLIVSQGSLWWSNYGAKEPERHHWVVPMQVSYKNSMPGPCQINGVFCWGNSGNGWMEFFRWWKDTWIIFCNEFTLKLIVLIQIAPERKKCWIWIWGKHVETRFHTSL